jgi:hypothetical protein
MRAIYRRYLPFSFLLYKSLYPASLPASFPPSIPPFVPPALSPLSVQDTWSRWTSH